MGDPTRVPGPMHDRRVQIDNLIDSMHAALIHVRREWRVHGEGPALVHFVRALLIGTTALNSLIEIVREEAEVTPASFTEAEIEGVRRGREIAKYQREANQLLEDFKAHVNRLPEVIKPKPEPEPPDPKPPSGEGSGGGDA